jgi:hypothetical protein
MGALGNSSSFTPNKLEIATATSCASTSILAVEYLVSRVAFFSKTCSQPDYGFTAATRYTVEIALDQVSCMVAVFFKS